MLRILFGFLCALLVSIAFSLLICLGMDPEMRGISDALSPLLGIFLGTCFISQKPSWKTGAGVGMSFAVLWIGFWMYVMGRYNPLLWIQEGVSHLSIVHFVWWAAAVLIGVLGGLAGRARLSYSIAFVIFLMAGLLLWRAAMNPLRIENGSKEIVPGFQVERKGPEADQTIVYILTFDFERWKQLAVGLYDCDGDDARPYDDSNTTYMGQSLEALVDKLRYQAGMAHRQLLCTINGGFFGASGFSVANHEEPIVQDGRVLYDVDLLRPKNQAWLFAINSATGVLSGQPRFSMLPFIPWEKLGTYQTVLGGVRPLRVDGNSIALKPGAGATTLKCARTSVGWSADGNKFYILVVSDPDSEAASQMQRKNHWFHAGGWDVRDVQKFWEEKNVPFALLFDGGESTQLAYRQGNGDFRYLASGYQYSYTLGYFHDRPLLLTLPILPPGEAHRGVLNYLYVDAPAESWTK